MAKKAQGGVDKKRAIFYAGLVATLILPGIIVYYVLSLLYQAQVGLPASQRHSGTASTNYGGASSNRVISANSYRDFGAVCGGYTVKNAAPYTGKNSAIIVTFSQSPRTKDSWSYEDVGYGRTYTNTEGDFTKISTVACLHEIRDTKVLARTCSYGQAGRQVQVKYYSIHYKLSYYEAKTGKLIADAGNVEATGTDCPSFVAYDEQTLTAYATPPTDVLDIAHTKFVSQ